MVENLNIAIGNNDIKTVALEKLKAELAQSRFDAKQTDRNIWLNEDEIIVFEHQEKERSMDCWFNMFKM